MVNGNTLLEFEEDHPEIDEEFLDDNKQKFIDFCYEDEDIVTRFKEEKEDKWGKFVMEKWDDSMASEADYQHEMARDRQIEAEIEANMEVKHE